MNDQALNEILAAGYRPVALLALYDCSLLIRPEEARDKNPDLHEYPETTNNFSLDGAELARLAEIFMIDVQPFSVKAPNGTQRYQGLSTADFFPIQRVLEQQERGPNPVRRLFALEGGGVLKLAAEHSGDRKLRFTSYQGSYFVHWDF